MLLEATELVGIYPSSDHSKRYLKEYGHPTLGNEKHADTISIEFDAPELGLGRVAVDATRREDLIADSFVHVSFTDEGREVHATKADVEHCYYSGSVRGRENDTSVTLTTCGKSGISGYLLLPGSKYAIQPAKNGRRLQTDSSYGLHEIAALSPHAPAFKCGAVHPRAARC